MQVCWLEQSTAEVPAADDWLAQGEKLRLGAMRFPKRRNDWRLGRWTAKRAVAAYLDLPNDLKALAAVEIRSAASGAPEVFHDNEPAEISISISHCAGSAVCAAAPSHITVGCDLELIEPRSDAFLADYFTEGEQALVTRVPGAQRVVFSNLLWSAKESALKALKVGLRLDTRCIEVNLGVIAANGAFKHQTESSPTAALHHVQDWRPLTVSHGNGHSLQGWWLSADHFVRTIVTVPSSTAPGILSVFPR